MNIKKTLLLITCIAVISLLAASFVTAADASTTLATVASVHVKNNAAGTGVDILQCNIGTNLWVFWFQASIKDPTGANTIVEIKVIAPDGTVIRDVSNLKPSDSGTSQLEFTTSQATTADGDPYYVVVYGAYNKVLSTNAIASQTLLVLPESVLGTALAMATGLAAVGVFGVVKTRRIKNQ
jgi:hypothetical protein